jgi:outer membrane protein
MNMNTVKKLGIRLALAILGSLLFSPVSMGQNILTMEDAMNIAIKNSPDIIKSELTMTISKENLNALEAATKSLIRFQFTPFNYIQDKAFDTQSSSWVTTESKSITSDLSISQPIKFSDGNITLHNVFSYRDNSSDFLGVNSEFKGYSNDFFIAYAQPIFTYNRLKMELKQLRLSLENATLSYAIQRLFLEKQVTQFFYMVYQRKMAVDVAQEELKNQQVSMDIIKSKVEGGLSAQEEMAQIELNLATSISNLQNAQVELANAKDNFSQYIGKPLNEEFEIEANVEFAEVLVDLDKAIENGLNTRMELRQREISLENSKDQLTVAKSTNEFDGNVNLSMGLKGEDPALNNIYVKPTRSPAFMLTFNIPIWDWGERKSRIKAAEAGIRIEEINLESERISVEVGIRQTFRSLQNLSTQMDLARQNVKNAQFTYEINLERYKSGDLTSMDLGRYQNQLSEKKMNLVNSLISYKIELLNMKIQSLWDFENNTSFVPKEVQENLGH